MEQPYFNTEDTNAQDQLKAFFTHLLEETSGRNSYLGQTLRNRLELVRTIDLHMGHIAELETLIKQLDVVHAYDYCDKEAQVAFKAYDAVVYKLAKNTSLNHYNNGEPRLFDVHAALQQAEAHWKANS